MPNVFGAQTGLAAAKVIFSNNLQAMFQQMGSHPTEAFTQSQLAQMKTIGDTYADEIVKLIQEMKITLAPITGLTSATGGPVTGNPIYQID